MSDPHPGPDTVWSAYEFPYKPGDLERRPVFVAPHLGQGEAISESRLPESNEAGKPQLRPQSLQ